MIDVGFIRPQHAKLLIHDDNLDGLLDKLAAAQPSVPIIHMTREQL